MHSPCATRSPNTSSVLAKLLTWASLAFLLCMAFLLAEIAQRTRSDQVAAAEAAERALAREVAEYLSKPPAGAPAFRSDRAAQVVGLALHLRELEMPAEWALGVYGDDGALLAREPLSDTTLPSTLPALSWGPLTPPDEGSDMDRSGDEPKIRAWKRVPGSTETVIISQPLTNVLTDWRRKVLPSFLFGLAAVGGLALLSSLAVRRARAEQRTQEQLIRSSQALELMLEEKDALLAEIHHRVKNNMQVVVTMLQMEAAGLSDDGVRGRLDEMGRRIALIGRIHERIYAAERFARMDVAAYLNDHCSELAVLHGGHAMLVEVEPLSCGLDTALPLSLIAHELVTNALRRHADVAVRLRRHGVQVTLTVKDRGKGPVEWPGLGRVLVRVLCEQIDAQMNENCDGGHTVTVSMAPELFVDS